VTVTGVYCNFLSGIGTLNILAKILAKGRLNSRIMKYAYSICQ